MGAPPGEDDPHWLGHRERLKARFREAGGDALPDYELLELALFRAVPRRDVKPLAKALIKRFGSFAEVLGAPRERLLEIKGVGESVAFDLALIAASARRMARGAVAQRESLGSWAAVIEYCRAAMAFSDREEFRVLFLDKRNGLIADEVQGRGTIDHVPVYSREIMRRALELGAAAVVLVHNHPSGDPTPSAADVKMTREIVALGQAMNVQVHDHIIVGRNGHASLKGMALM